MLRRSVRQSRALENHLNILAILQARATSTRLPGKTLAPILGRPMLVRQLERVSRSRLIESVVVATSDDASDDEIAQLCLAQGVIPD